MSQNISARQIPQDHSRLDMQSKQSIPLAGQFDDPKTGGTWCVVSQWDPNMVVPKMLPHLEIMSFSNKNLNTRQFIDNIFPMIVLKKLGHLVY